VPYQGGERVVRALRWVDYRDIRRCVRGGSFERTSFIGLNSVGQGRASTCDSSAARAAARSFRANRVRLISLRSSLANSTTLAMATHTTH
jgi:hypothetical protein